MKFGKRDKTLIRSSIIGFFDPWEYLDFSKTIFHFSYKILFLDVLFPLNLERIIFVDADQV